MKHIVTISGGLSSAWVANWAKENLPADRTVYYFNDVKWEHPDLYRFLDDIERVLNITITKDNDGRNPEQVFIDQHMLGNNRAPLCSKILKAKRLQKFCEPGDVLYFGIDCGELKRAARISAIYARLQCKCVFPIIDTNTKRAQMEKWCADKGIILPELYRKGFIHNNCHGGCVRAGVKQWRLLYETYPEIYADRERVETEFNARRTDGKEYSFVKNWTLKKLREKIEAKAELPVDEDTWHGECIGICDVLN